MALTRAIEPQCREAYLFRGPFLTLVSLGHSVLKAPAPRGRHLVTWAFAVRVCRTIGIIPYAQFFNPQHREAPSVDVIVS